MKGARDGAGRQTRRGIGGSAPESEDLTARARIRDAALKHFTESGFAKATIREIARTAGVSPGLVRHHFGSKEDLRDACDAYVLQALHRFNDQALEREGQPGGAQLDVADRHALDPFQRYLVNALRDESSVAAPIFDEMVKMVDRWLARADAERPDPPRADRTTRAALMVAQSLGIATFHEHISRTMGMDIFSADGDRTIALAMLDIYSHPLVSPEYAASAEENLAGGHTPGPAHHLPDDQPPAAAGGTPSSDGHQDEEDAPHD
ncbi:TetR/AcrR family transcriptional regulator [Streptomyces sparsogenes]|uniref:TetR/AcrR family transcriptional regulator n=1 Tax=Streptomyces sparsogenes TaxID=67365 RepID=UPI0034054391